MESSSLYGKQLAAMETKRDLFAKAVFSRPDSLSRLLEYEEYLQEHRLFVMKNGELGAIFDVTPLEHESMSGTAIEEAVKGFETFLDLPDCCVLQVHFYQNEVGKEKLYKLGDFEGETAAKTISHTVLDQKFESYASGDLGTPVFERRIILSIKYTPKSLKHSKRVKNALKDGEAHLLKEIDQFVKDLKEFRAILDSYLVNANVHLAWVDGQGLLDICRPIYNPVSARASCLPSYKSNESLSDQIVFSSGVRGYEGLEAEGHSIRTVSLKGRPGTRWPGMSALFTTVEFPFVFTINVTFPEPEILKKKLTTKLFFLENAPTANSQRQKEEATSGLKRLEYGDRGVSVSMFGQVSGQTEEIVNDRSRKLQKLLQDVFETAAIDEKCLGFAQVLCSTPLTFNHLIEEKMQRSCTLYMRDVVCFLPFFDAFKGTHDAIQLYLSRENSPVPFSPFADPISNHSVVVADTGAGKSALVINKIVSAKLISPEPLIFIVDKQTSYSMLTKLYGGDITVFDPNNELPFSPFRGVYDESKVSFLTQLLIAAISLTSSTIKIDSEHLMAIAKALRHAYNNKYNQRGLQYVDGKLVELESDEDVFITVEDVVRELSILKAQPEYEQSQEEIDQLMRKLKPFYGDGPYSRFFSVSKNIQGSATSFRVYDLDGLTDPVLVELITMSIFEEIRMTINRPENKGRMSVIVAEELGQTGDNNPTAAKYWADFAETMRKKGVWLIGLAPNPEIFFKTNVGRAFWVAATHYYFMQMSADSVQIVQNNSDLIDDTTAKIIKSLRTIKNEYADIFYTNGSKSISGVFRSYQTSTDKWLSPTNQKDALTANKALSNFQNDVNAALKYLVTNFPVPSRKARS